MTTEEIKIRQLTNQYLITPSDKLTVVRDLLGVQSQFMVNALHSLKTRCSDYNTVTIADGLVKNWTIRGTVHVFAEDDLPLFKHDNKEHNYHSDEWRGYVHHTTREYTLTPERQQHFSHVILDALKECVYTRDELKIICVSHGMTQSELESMFDQWGGGIRDLCERGFMCYVVQEKKAFQLCPPFKPMNEDEANLEKARRYFTNMAPATIKDAAYFFGTTQTQIRAWLEKLPVTYTDCGGKIYYYIENGKTYKDDIPDCIFLAGFDQLMLGYQKKESLYLSPDNLRDIFNLAGIVMPSVLLHGTIVGKWKRKSDKLSITAFSKISDEDKKAIINEAEELWKPKKIEWL